MRTAGVRRRWPAVGAAAGCLATLGLAAIVQPASATFPGKNGRIAYSNNEGVCCGDVHLVKPDGSGDRDITNTAPPTGEYNATISPNGRKVIFERDNNIWMISSKGKGLRQLTTLGNADDPAFSPNGRKIVFTRSIGVDRPLARRGDGARDIWIMRKDGSRLRQLTSTSGDDQEPTFAANGKLIAFMSARDGDDEIFTMRPNGKRERQRTDNDVSDYDPSFSPDSKRLVFARNGPDGGLYKMKKGGGGVRRVTVEPTQNAQTIAIGAPTFSPNGKLIAYRSLGPPNQQLIVISKSGAEERVIVDATEGDVQSPDWGPKPSKKKRRGGRH
jgi:Tol biopolymer transport system component